METEWQDDGRFVRVQVADPDGYSNEHEEIASYIRDRNARGSVGDRDTANLARDIRREEERGELPSDPDPGALLGADGRNDR